MLSNGVALALVLASPSLPWLFATIALLALCTALSGPSLQPLLSAVFPDRAGTAIGITQAAGNLGNTVLPPLAGVLGSVAAWQIGLGVLLPVYPAVRLAAWRYVPRSPVDRSAAHGDGLRATLGSLAADFTARPVTAIVTAQVLGSAT